uniref:Uncharacterized protein n=1 Tax=Ixodes ricinus TaxID=34613 RepID=A0A6B0UB44_IXORI
MIGAVASSTSPQPGSLLAWWCGGCTGRGSTVTSRRTAREVRALAERRHDIGSQWRGCAKFGTAAGTAVLMLAGRRRCDAGGALARETVRC